MKVVLYPLQMKGLGGLKWKLQRPCLPATLSSDAILQTKGNSDWRKHDTMYHEHSCMENTRKPAISLPGQASRVDSAWLPKMSNNILWGLHDLPLLLHVMFLFPARCRERNGKLTFDSWELGEKDLAPDHGLSCHLPLDGRVDGTEL